MTSLPASSAVSEMQLVYPGLQLWAYLKVTSQPEAHDPDLAIIQANLLLT